MKRKGHYPSPSTGPSSRSRKKVKYSRRTLPTPAGVEEFGRSSTGRFRSAIGRAAGATLGFITNNVGGAVVGYNVGGYLADRANAQVASKKMAKSSVSVMAQKKLINRSSMSVSGKNKVKRTKTVKVSKRLRKAIKQVMSGQTARGSFTTVVCGFVGSVTGVTAGALAGDDLGKTQSQVVYNAGTSLHGRTLFNQLVNWAPLAASSVVAGTGMNYFTPGKILNAASVLFNNKPLNTVYNIAGNLSTHSNGGAPLASPGDLKINVLSSHVQFTMKNVSNRVVTVEIWECTPTLKFSDSNPLQNLVTTVNAYSETTDDRNFQYVTAGSSQNIGYFDATFDPLVAAKAYMGFKYTWKKRSMVMAPDETCIHSIKGPKGVFDFKSITNIFPTPLGGPFTGATAIDNLNTLMKGWSVGCIISVNGDYVLPNAATSGGRFVYTTTAGALGMPVAVEIKETYNIAVPEVAGYTTANGAVGTQQLLNMRKPKRVVWNAQANGAINYGVSNEVNPVAETTVGAQNQ